MIRDEKEINDLLKDYYEQLHGQGLFLGETWHNYFDIFKDFIPSFDYQTILDFGCGPKGGLAAKLGNQVIPFDPYIPEYSEQPWNKKFNIFFSCDVFEHIPYSHLWITLLNLIRHLETTYIFLGIATRTANKIFPSGINVHLTVKSADWWEGFLTTALYSHYNIKLAEANPTEGFCILGFVRRATSIYANIGFMGQVPP